MKHFISLFRLLILIVFVSSCKDSSEKPFLAEFKHQEFIGFSKSDIAGYNSEWMLIVEDSNNVSLLRTYISENNNFRKNDSQFFLTLKKSDKYDYELISSFRLYASGCDKPSFSYLDSDSILIALDSTSFEKLKWGKFRLTSELGHDSIFSVSKQQHTFKAVLKNGDLDTSCFIVSYEPPKKSIIKPFKLVSGVNCGIYIQNYDDLSKYYLNKKGDSLLLIIDNSVNYGKSKLDTIVFCKN